MKLKEMLKTIKQFICKVIILGSVVILVLGNFKAKDKVKELNQEIAIEQQINNEIQKEINRKDIDIKREILENKLTNAKMMIEKIDDNQELVLKTLHINCNNEFSRKVDGEFTFFNNASIDVESDFTVKLGIDTSLVNVNAERDGNVNITYNKQDIHILSIETNGTTYAECKQLFGKSYSKKEMLGIMEYNKNKVRNEIINSGCLEKAEEKLQDYYLNIAKQFGVHSIQFNNGSINITTPSYVYHDCTNVKYGHNNEYMEEIKFIVIHSTANPNLDALSHIAWLNNDGCKDQNSAHFYIDDVNVCQSLDLDIQGWHTGNKYNKNSIGIEICEFKDKTRQLQAIKNTRDVLCILQEKYPDAKVVFHKELSSYDKNCPLLCYGDSDSKIMSPEELLHMLGVK